MTMSEWALRWDRGSLVVQSLGAMLLPRFDLPDDRSIAPLATPPWAREPRTPGQPLCVEFMRGEWPCIPFGLAGPSPEVAPRWRPFFSEAAEGPLHGPGSNLHWSLLDRSPRHLSLRVDYPAEHEIAWVERRLSVADGRAAVDCELAVMARRDARLPIGLHPIVRLPRRSGAARLRLGAFKFGITCPYRFEAKGSVAGLDRRFTDLARVPAADGRPFDLSRYPLEGAYEDALQLCGIEGRCELDNLEEGYTFSVEWDPVAFPSCIVWISNAGRKSAPWNGRHLALGIEPVCSALGLGNKVSEAENPLVQDGEPTAARFRAGEIWRTQYRLGLEPLA